MKELNTGLIQIQSGQESIIEKLTEDALIVEVVALTVIFLYELPSGEKVFWAHETIYDISSGLPAGKMEKIFSVEKSTFHGDYLLDFNADGYLFCWFH